MEKDFYLGHELKKKFRAKIFALLTDFSNDKIWSANDAKELQDVIKRYSEKDKEFVKRTISYYEKKTGQRTAVALMAAEGI